MKKGYPALLVLLIVVLFAGCAGHDKIKYNIPKDYPKERKKELMAALDKGKTLFKENCSGCHGIFAKGKDGVPNFTTTQLDNYSARFVARDRKNHAAAIKMSPDQLNEVMIFLRFRVVEKPDTAAVRPGKI